MNTRPDLGVGGGLCPGGRCAAVLAAFARWREEKRVEWSLEAGRQLGVVVITAVEDARLPPDLQARVLNAFADRMERVAKGDSEWLTGEGGEVWVGPTAVAGR